MLDVRNLEMRFGRVTALAGVSFSAADGSITGLLGENGAGKTTTLNIVSGLHRPNQGHVMVDGQAADSPFHRRQRIGALLDQKGLYARLTVRLRPMVLLFLLGVTPAAASAALWCRRRLRGELHNLRQLRRQLDGV